MSHPVYLLNGESFLAQEALERIRAETGAEPLSDGVFDPGASPAEILGALENEEVVDAVAQEPRRHPDPRKAGADDADAGVRLAARSILRTRRHLPPP